MPICVWMGVSVEAKGHTVLCHIIYLVSFLRQSLCLVSAVLKLAVILNS